MNTIPPRLEATDPIPTRLYEEARRRLLANAPLRTETPGGSSGLTKHEADVLESVGLSTKSWIESADNDPLRQSIADYMALLETSLTAGEVATFMQVDVSRIRQRLRERSLFGVDYEGEYRLPRFQFERGHVLPGLREILSALPAALNPLDVAQWFLAPNPDLELPGAKTDLSPRAWLMLGRPVDVVLELARGLE